MLNTTEIIGIARPINKIKDSGCFKFCMVQIIKYTGIIVPIAEIN